MNVFKYGCPPPEQRGSGLDTMEQLRRAIERVPAPNPVLFAFPVTRAEFQFLCDRVAALEKALVKRKRKARR